MRKQKKEFMKTVYMTLKSDLQNQTPISYENWPPLASGITAENIKKLVSPCLFDFMAWLLGFSDDPEFAQYITLEEKQQQKFFCVPRLDLCC